jgi:hypothetical protein
LYSKFAGHKESKEIKEARESRDTKEKSDGGRMGKNLSKQEFTEASQKALETYLADLIRAVVSRLLQYRVIKDRSQPLTLTDVPTRVE